MDKYDYIKSLREFYSNVNCVWPSDNRWHEYTHRYIDNYVYKKISKVRDDAVVLNAGSGGNTYGFEREMYHLDIVENKIADFGHHCVGTVENIPYPRNMFDVSVCVGTVINYNDAETVIRELARVTRLGGMLILEFENSGNPEFKNYKDITPGKRFVTSEYMGNPHSYWAYSEALIRGLLKQNGFRAVDTKYFHTLSAFIYHYTDKEDFAALFAGADKIFGLLKPMREHCANIILTAQKA